MKKFNEIEKAESDEDELFGLPSQKGELIAKLAAEGKHPILVGRAVVVLEQCEDTDKVPEEVKNRHPLRISIYSDQDVREQETPNYLFLEASKYGLPTIYMQIIGSDDKERIFKFEEKLIRDEFD
jgi:hypothetical protein